MLADLQRAGVRALLSEGGPTMHGALWAAGVVDELLPHHHAAHHRRRRRAEHRRGRPAARRRRARASWRSSAWGRSSSCATVARHANRGIQRAGGRRGVGLGAATARRLRAAGRRDRDRRPQRREGRGAGRGARRALRPVRRDERRAGRRRDRGRRVAADLGLLRGHRLGREDGRPARAALVRPVRGRHPRQPDRDLQRAPPGGGGDAGQRARRGGRARRLRQHRLDRRLRRADRPARLLGLQGRDRRHDAPGRARPRAVRHPRRRPSRPACSTRRCSPASPRRRATRSASRSRTRTGSAAPRSTATSPPTSSRTRCSTARSSGWTGRCACRLAESDHFAGRAAGPEHRQAVGVALDLHAQQRRAGLGERRGDRRPRRRRRVAGRDAERRARATQSGVAPRSTSLRRPPQNMSCCWRTMPSDALSSIDELDRDPWCAAVASSCTLSSSEPSPVTHTTVASGRATCAPMAAGRPKPIVPSPPEVIQRRGCVEAQAVGRPHLVLADVGGDDRVARRRRARRAPPRRRCAAAGRRASRRIRSHQAASRPGRPRRRPRSRPARASRSPRSGCGRRRSCRSRRVDVDVHDLGARGELAESPVTRSSNRAPTATIRSASSIAQLAAGRPCMPSIPIHCGSLAGNAPSAISVVVTGAPCSVRARPARPPPRRGRRRRRRTAPAAAPRPAPARRAGPACRWASSAAGSRGAAAGATPPARDRWPRRRDVDEHRAGPAGARQVEGVGDRLGDVAGRSTAIECLTIGAVIPITSASWKAFVPRSAVRTWPVTNSVGIESIARRRSA